MFDEDPVCNYPETVTVTNLPAFAIHDEPASNFVIPQNGDLGLIGEYSVTLKSEICVPDDYSQATCTTLFVEYDFVIQIEECIIASYDATQVIPTMTYIIGDPDLTSIQYQFEETPVCGYPETVTVTNLPVFVTHSEATADFTIPKTEDLSLDGTYSVTLRSEIFVPDDYSQATFTSFF